MNKPCVIIPIYKEEENEIGKKSLDRLYKMLPDVQHIYVVKESIYGKVFKGFPKISFPDYYFQGLITYSQLFISLDFWNHFKSYSHALVYQPDCWLWGDSKELEFWCKMGFAFIGPPHFAEYNYDKNPGQLMNGSMNGGFSLRDVKAHLMICQGMHDQGIDPKSVECHEDTWWCQILVRNGFRMPDPLTAARFGFEHGAKTLYLSIGKQNPFGAHNPWKFVDHYPKNMEDLL